LDRLKLLDAFVGILADKKAKLDWLLDKFAQMDTEQAELVATVFEAWNDFLIDGCTPTDDAIIREVHAWHPEKAKFTPDRIKACIKWLKDNSFAPTGIGPKKLIVSNSK